MDKKSKIVTKDSISLYLICSLNLSHSYIHCFQQIKSLGSVLFYLWELSCNPVFLQILKYYGHTFTFFLDVLQYLTLSFCLSLPPSPYSSLSLSLSFSPSLHFRNLFIFRMLNKCSNVNGIQAS